MVESPADVVAIEQSGGFRGRYFVLMGHLSPLDGIGPAELGLDEFERLLGEGEVREVILATNPTVEGEATAHYLGELALRAGLKASRIAHGVPVGGELEYVDGGTLAHALAGRTACPEAQRFTAPELLVQAKQPPIAFVAARRDTSARHGGAHRAARLLAVPAIVEAAIGAEPVDLDEAALGGAHQGGGRREIAHPGRVDNGANWLRPQAIAARGGGRVATLDIARELARSARRRRERAH